MNNVCVDLPMCGEKNREKQHEGRGMIASLFTKIKSENRFIYYLFLQNNKR